MREGFGSFRRETGCNHPVGTEHEGKLGSLHGHFSSLRSQTHANAGAGARRGNPPRLPIPGRLLEASLQPTLGSRLKRKDDPAGESVVVGFGQDHVAPVGGANEIQFNSINSWKPLTNGALALKEV